MSASPGIQSLWGLRPCFVALSVYSFRLKRLPAMPETRVRSLGREDPQVKEMATHSSVLAWRIPWTEEAGRLQSMGSQRVGHGWETSLSLSLYTHDLKQCLFAHCWLLLNICWLDECLNWTISFLGAETVFFPHHHIFPSRYGWRIKLSSSCSATWNPFFYYK